MRQMGSLLFRLARDRFRGWFPVSYRFFEGKNDEMDHGHRVNSLPIRV